MEISDTQKKGETSFLDIILKLRFWWSQIRPLKFRFLFFSLLIGFGVWLYSEFYQKSDYVAEYQLFFEEEQGGLSSAMKLASSFGLSLGGGGGTSKPKVQKYLTSRDNIGIAIMKNVNGQRLVDRYYSKRFSRQKKFKNIFYAKFDLNARYRDSIISEITHDLNKKQIKTFLEDKSGTLNFSVSGKDEFFVYEISRLLIRNTELQFLNWKRKKRQDAVNAFQEKVDSIELSIDNTLQRLGEYEDQNNSLVNAVDEMKYMRLTIDMEALKIAYGEYIKGLEMSKAELMNLEPPFKYFDKPTYPLFSREIKPLVNALFGFLGSNIFALLIFLTRLEILNQTKLE